MIFWSNLTNPNPGAKEIQSLGFFPQPHRVQAAAKGLQNGLQKPKKRKAKDVEAASEANETK